MISVGEAVEEVANGAPVLGDGLFPDRAQAADTGGDDLVFQRLGVEADEDECPAVRVITISCV